jgi:hypothetical protein
MFFFIYFADSSNQALSSADASRLKSMCLFDLGIKSRVAGPTERGGNNIGLRVPPLVSLSQQI